MMTGYATLYRGYGIGLGGGGVTGGGVLGPVMGSIGNGSVPPSGGLWYAVGVGVSSPRGRSGLGFCLMGTIVTSCPDDVMHGALEFCTSHSFSEPGGVNPPPFGGTPGGPPPPGGDTGGGPPPPGGVDGLFGGLFDGG